MNQTAFSFSFPKGFIPPYPDDFVIHVGDIDYTCHVSFLASFSPSINYLILSDPTIRNINFPFEDPNKNFYELIKFIYGHKITINDSNIDFFANAGRFFENPTLLSFISEYHIKKSPDVVLHRLSQNLPIKFIEREIHHIAENFATFMNLEQMSFLPLVYYDAIFSSPNFNLDLDDSDHRLFEWISNIVQLRGSEFIPLYSHVYFDALNINDINLFLSYVPVDCIYGALWHSIAQRLKQKVDTCNLNTRNQIPIESKKIYQYTDKVVDVPPELQILSQVFPYKKGGHFQGIFSFIGQNGNPQHRGYITMDCGGNKRRFLHILIGNYSATTFRWDNFSGERCLEKDQWFTIEFLIYKVRLEKYTLSSPEDKPDKSQPKSWRLFASNNGTDWVLLHEVTDCKLTNRPRSVVVFTVTNPCPDFYNHFKFVQLANHSKFADDQYEFTLNHVEFFGEVQKL